MKDEKKKNKTTVINNLVKLTCLLANMHLKRDGAYAVNQRDSNILTHTHRGALICTLKA